MTLWDHCSKGERFPLTSTCLLLCLSLQWATLSVTWSVYHITQSILKVWNFSHQKFTSAPGSQLTPLSDLICLAYHCFSFAVFSDTFSTIIYILSKTFSLFSFELKKKTIPIFCFFAQPKIKQYFLLFHFDNILYHSSKINVLVLLL